MPLDVSVWLRDCVWLADCVPVRVTDGVWERVRVPDCEGELVRDGVCVGDGVGDAERVPEPEGVAVADALCVVLAVCVRLALSVCDCV